MKELTEIFSFVTSDKRIERDIFLKSLSSPGDKKLLRLMEGVHSNRFNTDDEAMKTIYGDESPSIKYRVLKTRVKKQLVNLLFTTNTSSMFSNAYEKTFFETNRNVCAAHLLILNDKRSIAISLLKPALQMALHYEHTQIAVTAAQFLCYHEAYTGNETEMQRYLEICDEQQSLLIREFQIENLSNQVLARVTLAAGYEKETQRFIKKNFEKAQKLFMQNKLSYLINLYYHRIAMRYYHSHNQFQKVIEICRQFSHYMLMRPHLFQKSRLGEFALYEMESCMRMQRFEEGIQCAQRCLNYFPPYQTPWLQFNEYYFLLAMRTGNIHHALEIFNSVTGSKKFYSLPPIQKERWKLHEAFLNFALPDELPKKQFRLFKFLNEVQLANRDKPGYNYTVLLAQIILLINIDDVDRLLNVQFSFREYLKRYIKKDKHPRHYYFGEIIRLILKNNFTTASIETKAEAILEKMKLADPSLEETEIIPYEKLWKMLCQKCSIRNMKGPKLKLIKTETDKKREPEKEKV